MPQQGLPPLPLFRSCAAASKNRPWPSCNLPDECRGSVGLSMTLRGITGVGGHKPHRYWPELAWQQAGGARSAAGICLPSLTCITATP